MQKDSNQYVIPTGNTPEDIKRRQEIIRDFYHNWKLKNPEQKVYNRNIRSDIYVRNISIDETARHASKRYLSTLAVLQLTSVLAISVKERYEKVESRSNQKAFKAMLIMSCILPAIGKVKLTVGVKHKTLLKVQYCITAVELGE